MPEGNLNVNIDMDKPLGEATLDELMAAVAHNCAGFVAAAAGVDDRGQEAIQLWSGGTGGSVSQQLGLSMALQREMQQRMDSILNPKEPPC